MRSPTWPGRGGVCVCLSWLGELRRFLLPHPQPSWAPCPALTRARNRGTSLAAGPVAVPSLPVLLVCCLGLTMPPSHCRQKAQVSTPCPKLWVWSPHSVPPEPGPPLTALVTVSCNRPFESMSPTRLSQGPACEWQTGAHRTAGRMKVNEPLGQLMSPEPTVGPALSGSTSPVAPHCHPGSGAGGGAL